MYFYKMLGYAAFFILLVQSLLPQFITDAIGVFLNFKKEYT